MRRSLSRGGNVKTATAEARKALLLTLAFLASYLAVPLGVRAAAGDLDSSFGNGGRVTTRFPPSGNDRITALAAQPDGRLIAGAFDSAFRFSVLRYNQNGILDPTFGVGGRVITRLDGTVLAVALQPDGKI